MQGDRSLHFIQINFFSPLFLPVLVRSFLVTNLLHALGKKYDDAMEYLWHKFATQTGKICYLS